MKIPNDALGIKVEFLRFTDHPQPAAKFAVEKHDSALRFLDVVAVPIRHTPTTREGHRRTKAWARRQVVQALEAA